MPIREAFSTEFGNHLRRLESGGHGGHEKRGRKRYVYRGRVESAAGVDRAILT